MDAVAAEAAATRVMAMHLARQEIETLRAGDVRIASTWLIVGIGAVVGMGLGAAMGASRGHALGGALVVGLLGALLAVIRQRAI
ncbi:MAG TPA: hypothetical protein VFE72_05225 [Lysobacter sp.]|nr:hypothetical protein [Lysobacter sp.]